MAVIKKLYNSKCKTLIIPATGLDVERSVSFKGRHEKMITVSVATRNDPTNSIIQGAVFDLNGTTKNLSEACDIAFSTSHHQCKVTIFHSKPKRTYTVVVTAEMYKHAPIITEVARGLPAVQRHNGRKFSHIIRAIEEKKNACARDSLLPGQQNIIRQ